MLIYIMTSANKYIVFIKKNNMNGGSISQYTIPSLQNIVSILNNNQNNNKSQSINQPELCKSLVLLSHNVFSIHNNLSINIPNDITQYVPIINQLFGSDIITFQIIHSICIYLNGHNGCNYKKLNRKILMNVLNNDEIKNILDNSMLSVDQCTLINKNTSLAFKTHYQNIIVDMCKDGLSIMILIELYTDAFNLTNLKLKETYISTVKYEMAPGLTNKGNTCFHNAVAQLFYSIKELTIFLIHDNVYNQYKDNTYIKNFLSLIKMMYDKSSNASNNILNDELDTLVMKICPILPTYIPYSQDDSQAFLNNIIDALTIGQLICNDNNISLNINKSSICNEQNEIIKRFPDSDPRNYVLFIDNELKCLTGVPGEDTKEFKQNLKHNKDTIETLCRQYDDCKNNNKYKKMSQKRSMLSLEISNNMDITNTIKDMMEPKCITRINDEKYEIAKYDKSYNQIVFDTHVYNFEKYLLIHLLIFDNNGNKPRSFVFNKSNEYLDLSFGNINKQYELVSFVSHIGHNINGGHYIAYVKYDKKWYCYDDTRRYHVGDNISSFAINGTPYVLFYKQTSIIDILDPNKIGMLDGYLVSV